MERSTQKPIYFMAIRGVQALFGLIVLAMAAYFIHGASTSEIVWALICGLFTIGVAAINIVALRIEKLQAKPITLGLLGIDVAFIVFWLASMAANARLIALLKMPVTCQATFNNGEAINSHYCITKRTNYNLVVGPAGKGIIGAIIAFSLLEMFLFVAAVLLTVLHMKRDQAYTAPVHQSKAAEAAGVQHTPVPQQQQHYQEDNIWLQQQQNTSYHSQTSTQAPYQQPYFDQQQSSHAPYQAPYQYQQQQEQLYQSSLVPQHHNQFPDRTVSPVYDVGSAQQQQQQTYYSAPTR